MFNYKKINNFRKVHSRRPVNKLYKFPLKKLLLILCTACLGGIDLILIGEFSTDWELIDEKDHILLLISLILSIIVFIFVIYLLIKLGKDIDKDKKLIIILSVYFIFINIVGLSSECISLISIGRILYFYRLYSETILIFSIITINVFSYIFQLILLYTIIYKMNSEKNDTYINLNLSNNMENN